MDAGFDLYNLDSIYNSNYSYSLPKSMLVSFMTGESFGRKVAYTPDQDGKLRVELNQIFLTACSHQRNSPEIVMTAGAPGAGKTTLMERLLKEEREQGREFTYVDPDAVFLKEMKSTYHQSIAEGMSPQESYNLWRPASNFGCHAALANLIRDKKAIFFGTTSTGDKTYVTCEFLKKQGYSIKFIYVAAPDDVRWGSIQERDKTFVQTTEQDVKEKGDLLPQRIHDTFLKYADSIDFYYRSSVNEPAVLSARWSKEKNILTVLDVENYSKMKKIHDAVANRLKKPELLWETVEKSVLVLVPSQRERGIIK